MNTFNESNTVEAMLIEAAQKAGWDYVPIADVPRNESQILVEPWLVEALRRLNPALTPAQIDEVVIKLRTVCVAATRDELVTANQRFRKLLFEENSYPFGEDGMHVNVRFFDEERPENNRCVITNQWEFPRRSAQGGKRYDIVMVVNGIPMVICETKTPVRPSETWANAAQDMVWYQGCTPEMFVPNALCLATEGKELFYAGIGTPAAKWGPWFRDESRPHGDLASVAGNFRHLVDPKRILDIYRYYSLFTTVNDRKVKIVCRYQQYHGGEAIVQRVLKGYPKKGLIWHFQGSGKSWLMVFAAQKLRNMSALENPTVVIVDDRVDLEDQITGDFTRAEIPNLAKAGSREELETFFREDQRMILITTIFKFGEVQGELSDRNNIILLVDEAHRTQEGDLGVRMRMALPNAFFFGLTGTPINRRDINTFNTFGAKEDEGGYMSKYSFQDSIDDGATLELEFQAVPVELKIDKAKLDAAFEEMTQEYALTEEQQQAIVRRTNVEALFTVPKRISAVSAHVAEHFRKYILPTGLKAQLVVYNRANCIAYKKELDMLLGPEASTIVMHTAGTDDEEYRKWNRTRDEEKKVLDRFRDPLDPLKVVIVTSKLLTGFDAPILQCMYLDKPMKDHTLLQAICRTNRKYEAMKKCGLIVDYVGVFDDVAKSLAFDDKNVKKVVKNIEEIKAQIPSLMAKCLAFFPNIDRTVGGYNGLLAAQECLRDDKVKDNFAAHYATLHRAWEIVAPDVEIERAFKMDYVWLTNVFDSVRPPSGGGGGLIWTLLGPKTIELIHQNVERIDIGDSLEELVFNSQVLDEFIEGIKDKGKPIIDIVKILEIRLWKNRKNPKIKKLAEKLDELREKMRQNLIESIEFLKELLKMAREVLTIEKEENQPEDRRRQARAALTELFESIKSPEMPIIVENVVNDIDTQVVEIVRKFRETFETVTGQNEVKKRLRSILWLKYQIKDPEVFEKAYSYVEQYYN